MFLKPWSDRQNVKWWTYVLYSKGSAWGSWDLEPGTQPCHWSSKGPCHAPPLPHSHLDLDIIWRMMCSLCLCSLLMQSPSRYQTEQTQGRGRAVQWFPGDGVPAGFGPSHARNVGNTGQGLHSAAWTLLLGWGEIGVREFSYADTSPVWSASLDAGCKSRCNCCLQNRRWAENPLKAKGVFILCWWGLDQACCALSGWCLKLQKSRRTTKTLYQFCEEQRHLPEA